MTRLYLVFSLLLLVGFSGCGTYSTVTRKRPVYESKTPAGQLLSATLNHASKNPLVQIGGYLDAAAEAAAALERNPGDLAARLDYNFAVSRIIDVIEEAKLEPWKSPVHCPGSRGDWLLAFNSVNQRDPGKFLLRSADRYDFKGSLIRHRTVKQGLGAALVANSRGFDPTRTDRFAQGQHSYSAVTAVLDFQGRRCSISVLDPLCSESVRLNSHIYPLAADFTAPFGFALSEQSPRRSELYRLFRPENNRGSVVLARLQPYDPNKIPVLLIHGLGDSQATWAPMITALQGDATFRKNYQIWFFSYPTGYPYPFMAAQLRSQLDAIHARYPDHKPIIVLGHSMGGMIARALITDSGMRLWNAFFTTPPEKTPISAPARRLMSKALIFKHRPEIARVIFFSASLRGSDTATSLIGRLGAKMVVEPADLTAIVKEVVAVLKPREGAPEPSNTHNSITGLDPDNRFLRVINSIPPARGIAYHSVIGDRGKGGNLDHTPPVNTDGIVPYWSSHIDGAQSELVIPFGHWTHLEPPAAAEVLRILKEHLSQ